MKHYVFALIFSLLCPMFFNAHAEEPVGQQEETYVDFRFDNVDIKILAQLVGELTGKRFAVDEKIQGKITVVAPGKLSVSEVFPIFASIMDSSGYSLVEQHGVYRIVSRGDRLTPVVPVFIGGEDLPEYGVFTKVIHIENVRASELRGMFAPMVEGAGTGSSLAAMDGANYLVITDTSESIRRIEKIIKEIDKPDMARVTEIISLKHATADEMATELNTAIAGAAAQVALSRGERLQHRLQAQPQSGVATMPFDAGVVPAPHSNSLILVGTLPQIKELKKLIDKMDTQPVSGHGRIKAIFLQYLSSEEAATSLNALFAKTADVPNRQKIAIEPSVASNALVVDASPQDFETVKALLTELDKPPHQVMVEVMIAEHTSEDGSDLGVSFYAGGTPDEGKTLALGGSLIDDEQNSIVNQIVQGVVPGGLTFGVTKGSYTDASGTVVPRIPALINLKALQSQSKFNILSNIPLWAQNNQKASVNIVENIPILTSTIQGGSGTSRDVIQNIERIDVGIKLSLTPQVNPNNEIRMTLNPSIEAILDNTDSGLTPRIAKREVSTTVTVPDGETIVISGLIREDSVENESRVPILGYLPLIGKLFTSRHNSKVKTNLLIFVTPHIVGDSANAKAIQKMLTEKQLETPWPEKEPERRGTDRAGQQNPETKK
ncbi:MAG: type II secretion system secretin GspD [Lentisphaerae bacterium]|nr:type II secretion system secretin GspD [Lentisphaerota bacterium]